MRAAKTLVSLCKYAICTDLSETSLLNKLFVAFLGINQFRWVGLRYVCWFMSGTPKGSAEVVLRRSWESNLQALVAKT